MRSWTSDELTRIGAADELQIAPVRRDGSRRKPTTIWVVPHGPDLYVRAAYGPGSAWYQASRHRHEGHIRAGGLERDVTLTEISAYDPVNEQLDSAYRRKYRRSGASYVDMMVAAQARAATLRLTPR
jgi:hypothetical protein